MLEEVRIDELRVIVISLSEHRVPDKRVLDVPLLIILIVDVSETETSVIAVCPFEVVHKGPGEVALKVDTIDSYCIDHVLDVVTVHVNAEVIMQGLSNGDVTFMRD